jgi:hypothetical protein
MPMGCQRDAMTGLARAAASRGPGGQKASATFAADAQRLREAT